jgi:hypothetical protein
VKRFARRGRRVKRLFLTVASLGSQVLGTIQHLADSISEKHEREVLTKIHEFKTKMDELQEWESDSLPSWKTGLMAHRFRSLSSLFAESGVCSPKDSRPIWTNST